MQHHRHARQMDVSSKQVLSERFTSFATATLALAVVALLSACASSVRLDQPNSSTDATGTTSQAGKGGVGTSGAESTVKPVTADASGTSAKVQQKLSELPQVIYFDFDSYVVKPEATPTVEGYALVLKEAPAQHLMLEGHTDERGGREYNLALGQQRAEAVLRALTVLGASTQQLEAVSMGEEKPAAQGGDEAAWSKNRRVEFRTR